MAAGLKQLKSHINSVSNIQKVTGSMKMVAAARFIQAEKTMLVARPLGIGSRKFYAFFKVKPGLDDFLHVLVAFTSDRGLCGGCHLKVCKKCKEEIKEKPGKYGIICVGGKGGSILGFDQPKLISMVVNGVGHKSPTFKSASEISKKIIGMPNFSHATLFYPAFKNMLTFNVNAVEVYSHSVLSNLQVLLKYEMEDDDLLSFIEFSIAAQVFYAMCDAYLVELSARINAMSSASKNAGKLKKNLMLQYNRVRQASVTKELLDIIGGASVIVSKKN